MRSAANVYKTRTRGTKMAGRATDQPMNLISLEEARLKCDEGHSSFTRVESVEHICLAPSFLGRITAGVEKQLSKQLMKYSDKLQSVPVAYESLQLMRRHGTVVEESPFIHFDVRVSFIVFKPSIDSTLVGVVNKMDFDHIGCLVHGSFNASIATSEYSNGYFFRDLELGSEFEFRVVGFEAVNDVFFIFGSIDEECHRRNRSRNTQRPLNEDVFAGSGGHDIRSNGKVTRLSKIVEVKQEPEETPKKKRKTKCKSQDYSEIKDKLKSNSKTSVKSEKIKKKRHKTT